MTKTRWWIFTNYKLEFDYQALIESGDVTYIAYGAEECPTTGKIHHQGWLYRASPSDSVKGTAKLMGKCHVEQMRGRIDQNDVYCSKDTEGVLVEFGRKPNQGERKDLKELVEEIVDGKTTVDEILINNPNAYHNYGRTLARVEDVILRQRARTWMTKGLWLHGPTMSGKSHQAMAGYTEATHYIYKNDNGWWDGYTGQETVLFDDFRGEIKYGELLRLVDKWPMNVRRRNREPAPFLAKLVIITSALEPGEVYKNLEFADKLAQLRRRFEVRELELDRNRCYGTEVSGGVILGPPDPCRIEDPMKVCLAGRSGSSTSHRADALGIEGRCARQEVCNIES